MCIRMKPYLMNLLTAESATPVIGPLVSSERMISKNGCKYSRISNERMSIVQKEIPKTSNRYTQQTSNYNVFGMV